MDVVKLFVEEPAAVEVLAEAADPDPRRQTGDVGSLDAFLAGAAGSEGGYARAYLAGTRLGGDRPRVGLTAIADPEAFVGPLLAWAGGRAWTRLGRGGRGEGVLPAEAAAALRQPAGVLALAVAPGPVPGDVLATMVLGDRRYALPALRTFLDADPGAAVLFPEPAHDGHDWSLWARRPLGAPLADAFRQRRAGPDLRRFVAPIRAVRGEHRFYFEQWALDGSDPARGAPPAGVEPL